MILFISDLHLSPRTPGATSLFLAFLAGRARQAEALYILGDFFEAWVGDDDGDDPFHRQIIDALRAASDSGLAIYLLHGNRDFLLGAGFATASGVTLLPDPYVLSLPTWQFVLSHGDALCTDDTAYQAFRRQVRDPAWQQAFLAKPLAERQAIARHMRAQSEQKQTSCRRRSPLPDGPQPRGKPTIFSASTATPPSSTATPTARTATTILWMASTSSAGSWPTGTKPARPAGANAWPGMARPSGASPSSWPPESPVTGCYRPSIDGPPPSR